jgi:hypothetical protein
MEYWAVFVTCTNYRNFGFVGNTVLAIDKAPMLSGANPNWAYWINHVASNHGPSIVLSPATEEGVPDAEFVVGTDAGYGVGSPNLPICAVTNFNPGLAGVKLSCMNAQLLVSYADPVPARQPGLSHTINLGYGTKQVYYKAGRLFLAWTISNGLSPDTILWAEVRPVLNLNSGVLEINNVEVTEESTLLGAGDVDYYTPSIVGTDEDDIVLVYNYSGLSSVPSISYTGRKATDMHDALGDPTQGTAMVVSGEHPTTATWGKYSACATSLNSVTRGGIWCVGEYTGVVADPGWNTRLFNLRAE